MYFNNKSRENSILQVDNNFATLVNVTQSTPDSRDQYSGDELQFEFTYKLSQVKAIQEKTYSVAITIKTKNKNVSKIAKNDQVQLPGHFFVFLSCFCLIIDRKPL